MHSTHAVTFGSQATRSESTNEYYTQSDLTAEEKERLAKFGSLNFKSTRDANKMLIRVKFIPSKTQH